MGRETREQKRARLQRLKAELIQTLGGSCLQCGSVNDLEFAHQAPTRLNGRGRGKFKRLYDVKNNLLHYQLLCRSCHEIEDQLHENYPWVARTPYLPAMTQPSESRDSEESGSIPSHGGTS